MPFDTYWLRPFRSAQTVIEPIHPTSQSISVPPAFSQPYSARPIEYVPRYTEPDLEPVRVSMAGLRTGMDITLPQPPPVLSWEYIQAHPISYVLTHPTFLLLSIIIVLLIYVIVQDRRHREEMRLLGVRVRELSKHSEFVVSALQVNEERVETLADGVDKIDDAVLEVSRCVREAFSEKVVVGQANRETTLNNIGQSRRRRGRRLNHERDQGYETVDEDVLKEEVGVKSTYTELQYTTPDYKEDDDDWENRTVLTEVELIGSTKNKSKSIADKLDKERREDQV